MQDTTGSALSLCEADYGVCRIWPLAHLSRDKQHFNSSLDIASSGMSGRLAGSSVRVGEMEMLTMASKGRMYGLSEILDSSDQSVCTVCSVCFRLSLLCDCPEEHPVLEVSMRSALAKLDIITCVHSVNASIGRHDDNVIVPASFKYMV